MTRAILTAVILYGVLFQSSAQTDLEVMFSQRFNAYQAVWPRTKLHLIFNQEKFSPGDTVWFKAYFLKEDLTGVPGKQLLNLHLVDASGVSKLHFLFNVTDGLGYNQFTIPASLPAGIYTLTAYSNWMLNFDPAFIFRKQIFIVTKNELVTVSNPEIKIGVEGGHIVRDVANKIIILTNRSRPTMQIIDSTGQEVMQITANERGVASGIFTPKENVSYFLRIPGDTTHTPLPPTEADGCTLLYIPDEKDDAIKINVASPPGSQFRDQELVVVLIAQGKIYYTTTVNQGSKNVLELAIPKSNLPRGVAHVSVLSSQGVLLANRDIYIAKDDQVFAKVDSFKTHYRTRDKVKFSVTLQDSSGHPVEGEFSISAVNGSLFGLQKQATLTDKINIPQKILELFPIDKSNPDWLASLDQYLVLFPDKYPWKEILAHNISKPRYNFANSIQKIGRVYFADTRKPVPDHTQVMFYLQKDRMRYQTFTLSGQVRLTLPNIFGEDEFFYLAETKKEKPIDKLQIVWENELVTLPQSPRFVEIQRTDYYADFMTKKRLIDQSYGFYAAVAENGNNNRAFINDFEDDIVDADITVNINDYDPLPTMEDLIREVIPSLFYRKIGQNANMRVNVALPMTATDDPVYIIDGIATTNTEYFLSLKPSELLTIKIIKESGKLLPLQLFGKNGIVIVETKQGNQREPLDDPSKLIQGLSKPKQFITKDYVDDGDARQPDFRSTVYWNPTIKTDTNGKATVEFFCSDDVGSLNVRIDGMAKAGGTFSAEMNLVVSDK